MNESSRSQQKRTSENKAHNKVNTPLKNMTRCSTKYDARQVYMMQFMARDEAHKNNTTKQVKMRPERTYNNSGKCGDPDLEVEISECTCTVIPEINAH